MAKRIDPLTWQTVELLQQLIRNRCVNDGTKSSGQEVRNAQLLKEYLAVDGVEQQLFEQAPGRTSLISTLRGTDPSAPTLCLMGHTDVVPVTADSWRHDPFGGELIDGEVWGRGAVDMLNLTASMAVAFKNIAESQQRYRGDIIYFAVADEEAGGGLGAEPLIKKHWDILQCDYVLTEYGGVVLQNDDQTTVMIAAAEKGVMWRRLTIRGTPSHGSAPYGADNALLKAAEVIRRLQAYSPSPLLDETWRDIVHSLAIDDKLKVSLCDAAALNDALSNLEMPVARHLHACCHTTFSPNMIVGGTKTNTVPDKVVIDLDVRSLPGESVEDISDHLKLALGDWFGHVELSDIHTTEATKSSTETPLWNALDGAIKKGYPNANLVSTITTGGTDGRFFRDKGVPVYGAGLLSQKISLGEFFSRFHGNNERIDVESLRLTTNLWLDTMNVLLN